jgi:DUF971 family protein
MDADTARDVTPTEITLARDRLALTLCWENGAGAKLDAETLRLACRCAWCARDRILDRFPARFEAVSISHVAPIGGHALHIAFSDGHARGIFPWPYLHAVAEGQRLGGPVPGAPFITLKAPFTPPSTPRQDETHER